MINERKQIKLYNALDPDLTQSYIRRSVEKNVTLNSRINCVLTLLYNIFRATSVKFDFE